MSGENKHWYVVYTRPRWEKKVHSLMAELGMETYCPVNRVRKKWSDRMKWVEEPLFKSYVFVRVAEQEQTSVRMVNGVVNFVYWLGKPAIVKNGEIGTIRKFLNDHDEVWAEPLLLQKDAKIMIRQGAFMDQEGKVVKVYNNKVQVVIESIGYRLVAVLDKSNVAMTGKS
ncbi:MAG TPA: UpxY family transcription antiterminator [Puia sp.]|jgi:transcription antitermination factor NusG